MLKLSEIEIRSQWTIPATSKSKYEVNGKLSRKISKLILIFELISYGMAISKEGSFLPISTQYVVKPKQIFFTFNNLIVF